MKQSKYLLNSIGDGIALIAGRPPRKSNAITNHLYSSRLENPTRGHHTLVVTLWRFVIIRDGVLKVNHMNGIVSKVPNNA